MIWTPGIRKRWLVVTFVGVMALAVVCLGPWYLRRAITRQLAELTGDNVQIGAIAPGLRWQEARQIRLVNRGSREAWLSIGRVRLELSLWQALSGRRSVGSVVVHQPRIIVKFDRQRQMLTRLPSFGDTSQQTFESAVITEGRVEIQQPDRVPLIAEGISVRIRHQPQQLHAAITVGQMLAARWTGQAILSPDMNSIRGQLATQQVPLDSNHLRRLAMAPWEHDAELRATGEADLRCDFAISETSIEEYRVELQLRSLDIALPDRGVLLSDGQAGLTIDNGRVELADSVASILGGTVECAGTVDLRDFQASHPLKVHFRGISLDQFCEFVPAASRSPLTSGQLFADGDLEVTPHPTNVTVAGHVQGHVEQPVTVGAMIDSLSFQLDLANLSLPLDNDSPSPQGALQLAFELSDADLATVIDQFDDGAIEQFELPSGSINFRGRMNVPLSSLQQRETYEAEIDLQAPILSYAEYTLQNASAKTRLKDGRLICDSITVSLTPQGHVRGRFNIDLFRPGRVHIEADLQQLPLSLAEPIKPLRGEVSGKVAISAPTSGWQDLRNWQGDGTLQCSSIALDHWEAEDLQAQVHLAAGTARITALRAKYQSASLIGAGSVTLRPPFSFAGQLKSSPTKLHSLLASLPIDLATPIDGTFTAEAAVSGKVQPFEWTIDGEARATELRVAQWMAEHVDVKCRLDQNGVDITKANVTLGDSKIDATGTIPWMPDGSGYVEGTFRDISLSSLPKTDRTLPLKFSGGASGRFRIEQPMSALDRTIELEFHGLQAIAGGVTWDQLQGEARWQSGKASATVRGECLGGPFTVVGGGDLTFDPFRLDALTATLGMRDVQLAKITEALGQRQRWGDLQGIGSAEFAVDLSPQATASWGQGTIHLRDVRLATRPLTSDLRAGIKVTDQGWQIDDARCQIANGTVIARLQGRHSGGPADFRLRADGLSLAALSAFASKQTEPISGTLDAEFQGSLAERSSARGVVSINRARLGGVRISGIRIPAAWTVWPASGRLQARFDADARFETSGRVTAQGQLVWNRRLSLKGSGRVEQVDLQGLTRNTLIDLNNSLAGKLNGKVSFEGRNMRSARDLTGTYDAQLIQSQTLLLPAMEALTASLGIPSAGSLTFSDTKMRGTFGQGSIRVQEMTMEGPNTRMWVDGRISYEGGLQLNVTADTGQISPVNVAVGLINPIELLRRRLIFLELTGHITSPIVQPRTAEALAQEVVLFFLPVTSVQ